MSLSVAKFDVKEAIAESEVPLATKIIGLRWVLRRKERIVGGRRVPVKARLVAQEVNRGDHQDTFAGTPSSLGVTFVLWAGLEFGLFLVVGDVVRAFLQSLLPPCGEAATGFEKRRIPSETQTCALRAETISSVLSASSRPYASAVGLEK